MCLITEQEKPIILKKDKIVYKVLTYEGMSPCHPFTWEAGRLYTESLSARVVNTLEIYDGSYTFSDTLTIREYDRKGKFFCFSRGFHFSKTKKRLNLWREEKFRFKIPAGAEVYYDKTGLGITNKIMLIK
jgi:hypothetical protein